MTDVIRSKIDGPARENCEPSAVGMKTSSPSRPFLALSCEVKRCFGGSARSRISSTMDPLKKRRKEQSSATVYWHL